MNDILSEFQRKILDMMYMGDMANRGKFNVVVADKIEPLMSGDKYMDRSERELELKQLLGDILSTKRIGESDLVLLGREGMLYAGPGTSDCEDLVVQFSFLLAKEQFVRNYFVRMFILDDQIASIGGLIRTYDQDPNRIFRIREALNKGSQDIIMLEQTLGYLLDSLVSEYGNVDMATASPSQIELAEAVGMKEQIRAIKLRTNDMRKLVKGAGNKLAIQRQQAGSITQKLVAGTVNNIDANYTSLVGAAAADERAAVANNIMNLIFAGSFCFGVIDRLTGDDQLGFEGVDCGELSVHWVYDVIGVLVQTGPFLFCICNMTLLFGGLKGLDIFMANLLAKTVGAMGHRQLLNIALNDASKLEAYLEEKTLIAVDTVIDPDNLRNTVKTAWVETDSKMWSGEPPKLIIEYDPGTNFLLQLNLQWNEQRQKGDKNQLVLTFLEEMMLRGCISPLKSDDLKKLNLISAEEYEEMVAEEAAEIERESRRSDDVSEEKDSSKYMYSFKAS
jgi:WD repeat-containing protein 35